MAPVGDGKPGDVDVPLDKIVFEGTAAEGQIPPFHPAFRYADARLKALEVDQWAGVGDHRGV